MEKIDLNKIKLVIFDLDYTLWSGLLSEEEIKLFPYVKECFEALLDNGVVISVCSKNNFNDAKKALIQYGLWDYIVFPSIDWTSKGQRISSTLKTMGLRDENTLFVDDRDENLNEAIFYNSKLKTSVANKELFNYIINFFKGSPKKDSTRSKLQQYKELEKREEIRHEYKSNTEFLFDSNIELSIEKKNESYKDRIFEMIHKTNQLNFTKIRSTKEELEEDLNNAVEWGTVSVKDKYSNYGIVGFYLLDSNRTLKHFLFSCRTIGMGVEQFVYEYLGFPKISIVQPVSSELSKEPNTVPWVHLVDNSVVQKKEKKKSKSKTRILMKGPCDLEVISGYLENAGSKIDVEFTFQDSKGRSVEHQNSIINIASFCMMSDAEKANIINSAPFGHDALASSRLFVGDYDVVVLSCFTDFTIPVYRNKISGQLYSCGQYGFSLVDEKNWDGYISGKIYTGNFELSKEQLASFCNEYEYVGVDVEELYKSIQLIRNKLNKKTILILTLGSDTPYEKETNPVYFDTAKLHKEFHNMLVSKPIEGVFIADTNIIIDKIGQSAFTNNINHFSKQVYINLAEQISKIIDDNGMVSFKVKKYRSAMLAKFKRHIRKIIDRK